METLSISLLGTPLIHWGQQELRINRRGLRALLFYLALESPVSRSQLCMMFWPEASREAARKKLRTTLSKLRAELPDLRLVEATTDTVTLDLSRVWVDARQFLEQIQKIQSQAAPIPGGQPLPSRQAHQLREAVDLWRSPQFLSGFSLAGDSLDLDHWLDSLTARLEMAYLWALRRLAEHEAATGYLETALSRLQTGLEVDPLQVDLHSLALNWLLAAGKRAEAAARAKALLKLFEEEAEELGPELEGLCDQALTDPEPAPVLTPAWPVSWVVQTPWVHRSAELAALQAANTRGGVAVLWGEAGSGKSRLAYEFFRNLETPPRLLIINALPGGASLPFQALLDALRQYISPSEWRSLPQAWIAPFAHLLPEIDELRRPGLKHGPLSPDQPRSQIFEAFRQLLEQLRGGRLWLVLENAQWCDESTLTLLSYLAERQFFDPRRLLLLIARIEEPSPALDQFIRRESPGVPFQQIHLSAFGPLETGELAHQVLGQPLDEESIRQMFEATGGNPLFILEILRSMLDLSPEAGWPRQTPLPLGGNLFNLLHRRLDRLHPRTRQAAAAAVILGGSITPSLLEAVTNLNAEDVALALEELEQACIIRPVAGSPQPAYLFVHGKARDVIRLGQSPARLRLLHQRAARALEASTPDPERIAATLAAHYTDAGEILRAVEYWLMAADYARRLFSPAEAEQALQTAEGQLPNIYAPLPEDLIYRLYGQWIEIAIDRGDTQLLEQVCGRLLRYGEDRQSPLLVGTALSGQGDLFFLRGDRVRSLQTFRRAIYALEQSKDRYELIQAHNRLAWCLMRQVRYSEALEPLQQALALAGDDSSERLRSARTNSEYRLGLTYTLLGWPEKALQVARRSPALQTPSGLMYGHLLMSGAYYYLGNHPAALVHARQGIEVSLRLQSTRMAGYLMTYQPRIEIELGLMDSAWEHAQEALKFGQKYSYPDFMAGAYANLGDIYRVLGHADDAIQFYRQGMAVGEGKWDSLNCQNRLAMALLDSRQPEAALAESAQAITAARQLDLGMILIPAVYTRVLLLARIGDLGVALRHLESADREFGERQFGQAGIVRGWVQSQAALQRGDLAETNRLVELTLVQCRQTGAIWSELHGLRQLQKAGPLPEMYLRRAQGLVTQLDQSIRHPAVRPLFETYLQRAREGFGA